MATTRRHFVGLAAGAVATTVDARAVARMAWAAADPPRLKAVAFDAFPIFSPASVVARANELFPGQGAALCDERRLRQFELRLAASPVPALRGFLADDPGRPAVRGQEAQAGAGLEPARDRLMLSFLELAPVLRLSNPLGQSSRAPAEELGAPPDAVGRDLSELVRYLGP